MNFKLIPHVACIWEVMARKVGNVHPTASFADADATTFLIAASALRWVRPPGSVGRRQGQQHPGRIGAIINQAVRDSLDAVGTNTHLGAILLLTPLLTVHPREQHLRPVVIIQLRRTTLEDSRLVYEAIRLAKPGGLGKSPEQDVHDEPTVPLHVAMRLAADRDLIARQYANGFADVFDFGVPAFLAALERFGCVEAAIIDSQLQWLAHYPDSLIARKKSPTIAERVRKRAAEVLKLGGLASPAGRAAGVALDKHLRSDGNKLNPGTTADLITACLFVALREGKVQPSAPFRWQVEDWL